MNAEVFIDTNILLPGVQKAAAKLAAAFGPRVFVLARGGHSSRIPSAERAENRGQEWRSRHVAFREDLTGGLLLLAGESGFGVLAASDLDL